MADRIPLQDLAHLEFAATCDWGHPDGHPSVGPACKKPAAVTVTYHNCSSMGGDGTGLWCSEHLFIKDVAIKAALQMAAKANGIAGCPCGHIWRTPSDQYQIGARLPQVNA